LITFITSISLKHEFMDDIKTTIETIKDIVEICAILLAAVIAFRIKWQFVPIMHLDIGSEWLDKSSGKLKLSLTIENKSNVKAKKKRVRVQILEYDLSSRNTLSEWVPFSINEMLDHEKTIWKEPVDVWQPTVEFYPGVATTLDYMCHCPKGKLLHVGLFLETDTQDLFKEILRYHESWCTTRIIANPDESSE
jgi:hypothetical protein